MISNEVWVVGERRCSARTNRLEGQCGWLVDELLSLTNCVFSLLEKKEKTICKNCSVQIRKISEPEIIGLVFLESANFPFTSKCIFGYPR